MRKTRIVAIGALLASLSVLAQVADASSGSHWGRRRGSTDDNSSSSGGSSGSGSSSGSNSGSGSGSGSGSSSGGSSSGSSGGGVVSAIRVRLEARMRSGSTQAKLSFEDRGTRQKFQAEIFRGTPLSQYAVVHNGVQIGVITTNILGSGKIEVNQGGDDANQGVVPAMRVGDHVSIGAMNGVLAGRR